ncbi:hypothetical protein Megpolyxen_01905 (plasmid) [Candidatus Megaera polyxenophila]|nr:hypothetical protein Megpolyxen_01905 [Candidatus Megaera polyxenophila]
MNAYYASILQEKIKQEVKTHIDNWNELFDDNVISCTIFSYSSENERYSCSLFIRH